MKTVSTLALLAIITSTARAQSSVALGLKAGATYSNIVGDYSYKSIFGFHAGAFANIALGNVVAVQPELLYSQKGASYPALLGDKIVRRLHYVDVPVMLRFNTNALFVEAGPQVGFLVKAQDRYDGTTTALDRSYFNEVDFGYAVGLGYQPKSGLGLGVRYNRAFSNLLPDGAAVYNPDYRLHNSAFQLYLAYSFGG